ncbi:hypothetical protein BH11BAC5_BH11BAC5_07820 [soil metagenome]
MKIRYIQTLISTFLIAFSISSCQKDEVTTFTKITIPSSGPISAGDISGFLKGTLLTGQTYTIIADITVKKGDTLAAQPGAIVIVKNNAQINIQGVLQLIGSKEQPVSFNSDTNKPGTWGGFQCDTAEAITIKWTHVDNTGGPDASGSARGTLKIKAAINVDIEDSWFTNGQDDLIRIEKGATITIVRNTISSSGSTDGEALNLKTGVKGIVAFNVIFGQAGSGIKLETSPTIPFPQTEVEVYNNTIVSNGWRRGSAEPGRAVSVGVNAIGHIYNNIIVNNYHGIELFSDGDLSKTTYGNNLFYSTVDTYTDLVDSTQKINIRENFYPASGVGVAQASDLISNKIGNYDPLFVNFDGKVATPNGFPNTYDFHLQNGSPAFGTGFTKYNLDLGAYTTDGKGNQH